MANQATQGSGQKQGGQSGQNVARAEQSNKPLDDILHYALDFARDKPEQAALWCFGVGFILGWKLKPW